MKKPITYLFLIFLSFAHFAHAQDLKVNGTVFDENGVPLPGASVILKGTNSGTQSDFDGNFNIGVRGPEDVLTVTYVGYKAQEVTVGNQTQLSINLVSDTTELDDVVIIGYQKAHKKDVTAAVASISSKELESIPVISVSSLIASLSTGVQTPSSTGAPGGRSNIVIRGNTSMGASTDASSAYSNPLYVIDGVQTSLEDLAGYNTSNNDFLASLNPNDIQSIDMLKDASAAAIYGSRGANGVIIITTKKGTALDKPEFNFSFNTGIEPIPELVPMLTGGAERNAKMKMISKWWDTRNSLSNGVPMVLSDSLNPAFNNNVDYQGLFYRTGLSSKYNLSVRGGSEASNYRLSLGYDNIEGVVKNTGFKRYTFASSLNTKAGTVFDNQIRLNLTYTDNQTGQGNPSGGYYNFNSTLPSDPANLNSSLFYLSDAKTQSLRGELSDKLNTDVGIQTTISNLARFNLAEGLSFNTQLSLVYSTSKKNFYEPSTLREEGDGFASYFFTSRLNLSADNYLSYFKTIKEHDFTAIIGYKLDYNSYEDMQLYAAGFGSDAIKVINDRYTQEEVGGSTDTYANALTSTFGRISYKFKNRYLLDGTYSRDGSSRFGTDVRFANFWSASAGWIFTSEPFIKKLIGNVVNFGKLRGSYGVNGHQFAENYLRYGRYNMGYGGLPPYWNANQMVVSTYGGVNGVIPNYNAIGNNKLSWENTAQWNIGVDLDMFKNRLSFTFDAYNKKTDKLFFDVLFPSYSGYNGTKANVAGVLNYGWETFVKWQVFPRTNKFNLELSSGLSHNENYVYKLPNGNKDYYGYDSSGNGFGYVVGLPLNLYQLFENDYILDDLNQLPVNPYTGERLHGKGAWATIAPGFPIWKDLNGDYLLNEDEDFKLITKYSPTPKLLGSFNVNVKYKSWYFQAYSQFSFGADIINNVLPAYMDKYDSGSQYGDEYASRGLADLSNLSFWQQPGDGAAGVNYPAIYPTEPNTQPFYRFRSGQTLFLDSGDYWKVTNASFGYTFENSPTLDKLNLSRVRLYTSVLNPYQWQKSKNVPDASQVDATGHTYGNGYPSTKTISFGLDVKF